MGKLQHYLSLMVFVGAVMIGVQGPSFIDQYAKRVDGHYQEAVINFRRYQQIADTYHNGSVNALLAKHRQSQEPTFRAEAGAIESSHYRLQALRKEKIELNSSVWQQGLHILMASDTTLLMETRLNYSANFPLNLQAGVFGIAAGCVASILWELLGAFLTVLWGRNKAAKKLSGRYSARR